MNFKYTLDEKLDRNIALDDDEASEVVSALEFKKAISKYQNSDTDSADETRDTLVDEGKQQVAQECFGRFEQLAQLENAISNRVTDLEVEDEKLAALLVQLENLIESGSSWCESQQ